VVALASTDEEGLCADQWCRVREVAPPPGAVAYVGGQSALVVDTLAEMGHTLPWMVLVVVLATFLLLFLTFGSVLLPVKAIAMNRLSLSVMFGVLMWIFQEGHLRPGKHLSRRFCTAGDNNYPWHYEILIERVGISSPQLPSWRHSASESQYESARPPRPRSESAPIRSHCA
jgi:hypothetical protein